MELAHQTRSRVYSVGFLIAMSAAINHIALNAFLLMSYCAEVGCFQENCQSTMPNQCLPPRSSTYIPFTDSFGMHFRYYLAVTNSICVQAILESLLFHSAVLSLLQHSQTHFLKYPLMLLFDLILVVTGALEICTALVLNVPPTDLLHQELGKYLPSTWVFLLVPIYISALWGKPGVSSKWLAVLASLDVSGILLGYKLSLWTDHWTWQLQEWCGFVLHAMLIMAMGKALPRTFMVAFKCERCCISARFFSFET